MIIKYFTCLTCPRGIRVFSLNGHIARDYMSLLQKAVFPRSVLAQGTQRTISLGASPIY